MSITLEGAPPPLPQVGSQVLSFRTLQDSCPAPSMPDGQSGPESSQLLPCLCETGPGCLSPLPPPTGVAFCSQDHGTHSYSGWDQAHSAPAFQGPELRAPLPSKACCWRARVSGPPGFLLPSSLETPKSVASLWQGRLRPQGRRSILHPKSWSSWGWAGLSLGPGVAQVSVEGTHYSGLSRSLPTVSGFAGRECHHWLRCPVVGDRQARHRASGAPAKATSCCHFSALGTAGHSHWVGGPASLWGRLGAAELSPGCWSHSLQGRGIVGNSRSCWKQADWVSFFSRTRGPCWVCPVWLPWPDTE